MQHQLALCAETIMADTVSSSVIQPSAKRRRLNPAAIVPVPVYSSRVSSSLQLKPAACLLGGRESSDDGGDESLWVEFNPRRPASSTAVVELSDSEEEPEPGRFRSKPAENQLGHAGCPSPPPPESPVQKQSSKARRKLSEINKKLLAVSAVLSPEPLDRRTGRRRNRRNPRSDPNDDSDDVVIMSLADGSDSPREIPLKIRCRTDIHKVLVLPSTRLSEVLGRLAAILEVPPPRLLLLREELELPAGATVGQLGLGIADILEPPDPYQNLLTRLFAARMRGDAIGGAELRQREAAEQRQIFLPALLRPQRGAAELRVLPVPVAAPRRRPQVGPVPLRRLQGGGQPDGGAAGAGGRRHHRSLDLKLRRWLGSVGLGNHQTLWSPVGWSTGSDSTAALYLILRIILKLLDGFWSFCRTTNLPDCVNK